VIRLRSWYSLALAFGLTGCVHPRERGPAPTGARYVVGYPYQAGGEWRYPRVFDHYDRTGLAMVIPPGHAAATADGEAFHQRGLIAQSPVLPLPSLVRLTNLVNGRSLTLRVNDRGPAVPGRILAVTRKVAARLGFPRQRVVEARVRLLAGRSAALQAQLGQGPHLTAAPVAAVRQEALPPAGMAGEAKAASVTRMLKPANFAILPTTLSGRVRQGTPDPGPLYVGIGGFGSRRDAFAMLDRLSGLAGSVTLETGTTRALYMVQLGPYHSVAAADAALRAVLARGVTDPEIIVR
jgi:rare lipoprotein A